MRYIKYFFEEPAALELLAPDASPDARAPETARSLEDFLNAPRYYRGYLAGSDPARGLTGLTALPRSLWEEALLSVAGDGSWLAPEGDGWMSCGPATRMMGSPGDVRVVGATGDLPRWQPTTDERRARAAIRSIVDQGAVLLLAEPAPDGVDWAIYSRDPMADRMRVALADIEEAHCYVIPVNEARGEHRFYFERYDPELYSRHEVSSGPDAR